MLTIHSRLHNQVSPLGTGVFRIFIPALSHRCPRSYSTASAHVFHRRPNSIGRFHCGVAAPDSEPNSTPEYRMLLECHVILKLAWGTGERPRPSESGGPTHNLPDGQLGRARMNVVVFASRKGGSGKSTLAAHVAAHAHKPSRASLLIRRRSARIAHAVALAAERP
jgi:hypothetical protein